MGESGGHAPRTWAPDFRRRLPHPHCTHGYTHSQGLPSLWRISGRFLYQATGPCYSVHVPTRVPKGKVLLTVAIDPELRETAKKAAQEEEVTLTVYVTRALRERLEHSGRAPRRKTRKGS